uniref:Sushi domain-containing protein n=1 Tax=Sus scrofa TaxID=9823 RepID=A0A4X1UMV4_PIG
MDLCLYVELILIPLVDEALSRGVIRSGCVPKACPYPSPVLFYFHVFILLYLEACDDPPRFESMRFQGALQLTYRPGDRAQYECRLGFHPMVPALPTTSVCQDNNTWSPLQEACRRKSCPNLGDPVNGLVNYINGSRLFGSHAQYECNEGLYIFVGSYCLVDFLCFFTYLPSSYSIKYYEWVLESPNIIIEMSIM